MMRNLALFCVILAAVAFVGGCYTTPIMPPHGMIYSDFSAPLDPFLSKTTLGTRYGTAESTAILGLVATGDCSVERAALNGGVRVIDHADYHYFNVIGVYQRFIVRVYGTGE